MHAYIHRFIEYSYVKIMSVVESVSWWVENYGPIGVINSSLGNLWSVKIFNPLFQYVCISVNSQTHIQYIYIHAWKLKATISDQSVDFVWCNNLQRYTFWNIRLPRLQSIFKSTDTHQLLHRKSFHPHHTFKGIFISQIIRFHRISNNKQFQWGLFSFNQYFKT